MLLTVLAIWVGLAVPAALFVAALGRSGHREEEARDRPAAPTRPGSAADQRWSGPATHVPQPLMELAPLVAEDRS